MASITSWTRLEPDSRDALFQSGLQARLHDPLWTIARQWQVGEFEGEDDGSPVAVEVATRLHRLSRLRIGAPDGADTADYDPAAEPLEVLVEREHVRRSSSNLHDRFETGLHFLRLLEHAEVGRYRSDFIDRYALTAPFDDGPVDDETRRYVEMYRLRVPDGPALYDDMRLAFRAGEEADGSLPALPRIDASDRAVVRELVIRWLGWYDTSFSEPPERGPQAWNPQRLEYRFGVEADGADAGIALEAAEYAGGELDWYAFVDRPDLAPRGVAAQAEIVTHRAIPAPVVYRSMPSARWWEFEDGVVNLGRVDAGADDVLRMLMVDFALRFSNDWFVVPIEQPIGSFCRIESLVVTDCFGQQTLVESAGTVDGEHTDWRMFTLTDTADRHDEMGLFLAPALPPSLHSEAIEHVRLLRDEMANMAWAIEEIVQSPSGRGARRDEERHGVNPPDDLEPVEPLEPLLDAETAAGYRYRLGQGPARHWIPLVPVRQSDMDPSISLRRGRVVQPEGDDIAIPEPLGRILDASRPLDLFEEVVPRSGVSVVRHYQRVRWSDGSTHTWVGRRKTIGAPTSASNLKFDLLLPEG